MAPWLPLQRPWPIMFFRYREDRPTARPAEFCRLIFEIYSDHVKIRLTLSLLLLLHPHQRRQQMSLLLDLHLISVHGYDQMKMLPHVRRLLADEAQDRKSV